MTHLVISRNTIIALLFAFTCAAFFQMKVQIPYTAAQVQTLLHEDDLAVQEGAYCAAVSATDLQFVGCTGFF